MKTKMLIVGIVSLLMAMPATAQDTSYQYWSINFNGGFSGYLPTDHQFLKDLGPTFGLGLEWTATPLWGLSLDYQYFGFYNDKDYGHANEITLSGRFNLSNMVSKYRPGGWQKFNAYGHVGVGGSMALDGTIPDRKNEITMVIPLGVMFEYNINPLLALNLNVEGRWHSSTVRDVAYNPSGVTFFAITGGIRIKLGTRNHIRNICSLCEYEAVFQAPAATDEALKTLQCLLDENCKEVAKSKDAVEDANRQIDALKREIDNLKQKEVAPPAPAPEPEPVATTYSKTITFDFAMSVLKPIFYPYLDDVASELIKTKAHIIVLGHADTIGDSASKMKLSLNRAKAVVNYLTKKGVDSRLLTIKGMSDFQPVADNKTETGRQQNRRVEFIIQ